jgi:hypothetical protein
MKWSYRIAISSIIEALPSIVTPFHGTPIKIVDVELRGQIAAAQK